MSPRNPQLDGLRQQIDSLDDRIHDLLIERSGMIEQIIAAKGDGAPKLRPGREAEIARRLIARHRGHFPPASLIRIWREIINAFTCMQGPFSIAVSGAAKDRKIRELARDHFGGTPERVLVEDTEAALRAVIAGRAALAVLPWGERAGPWLRQMLNEGEIGLGICFGLPFVRESSDVETIAVAVGCVESEPTDNDRSLVAISNQSGVDPRGIEAAVREAGFAPLAYTSASGTFWDGEKGPFGILEIAGRLDVDVQTRLAQVLEPMLIVSLGTYAAPIILSSEEQADT